MLDNAATEHLQWLSPLRDGTSTLLLARHCARTWRLYHDDYAFCAVHAVHGPHPRLRYRRWREEGASRQVQLYEPGEAHECATRGPGDFTVLMIPGARIVDTARSLGASVDGIHFDVLASSASYEPLAAFSRAVAGGADMMELDVRLAHCLEALVCESSALPSRPTRIDRRAVQLAREYLDAAAGAPGGTHVRLVDVVRASRASSDAALCRDFKRQFNVGPYRYYKLRRLAIGWRLLQSGGTIRSVAGACGYDPASFAREFQGAYGVTPREFRRAFA